MNGGSDHMTKVSADDALAAKHSAHKLGYIHDPYIESMLSKSHGATLKSAQKRQPIINRGYFARMETIRVQLSSFLDTIPSNSSPVQIINLGSGYDTMSLTLLQQLRGKGRAARIFEVDFSDVIRNKELFYTNDPILRPVLFSDKEDIKNKSQTPLNNEANTVFQAEDMPPPHIHSQAHSASSSQIPLSKARVGNGLPRDCVCRSMGSFNELTLIGCDLRRPADLITCFNCTDFDGGIPSVVVSECTLVYMKGHHVEALSRELAGMMQPDTPAMWVSYDMTHSNDIYGKVMLRNLTNAGYMVPAFVDLPTLDSYKSLFERSGWGSPDAYKAESDSILNCLKSGEPIDAIIENSGSDNEDDGPCEQNESIPVTDNPDTGVSDGESKTLCRPAMSGSVESMTMLQAWGCLVSLEEKNRVNQIERLDEMEEWNMLMSHYCLTTACRNCELK